MKRLYSVAAVVCVGIWIGCGSGDGGGTTDIDFGIASDKALSDVTSEEMMTACERTRDAMQSMINPDRLVPKVCTLMAVGPAETEAECVQLRDECLELFAQNSEQAGELESAGDIECDGDVSEFEGCDVTVGELETCLNDSLDAILAVFDQYTCADAAGVDGDEFAGLDLDLEPPASCQPLVDRCDGAGLVVGGEDAESE